MTAPTMASASSEKLAIIANRVLTAQGPDRRIDAEIAIALNIGARGLLADDHEYLSTVRDDDGEALGTYWFHCRSGKSLRTAPEFTGCVTAALTLKDAEWLVDIEQLFDLGWEVELWVTDNLPATKRSTVKHGSLPQAIVASALRVRAELAPLA